MRADCGLHRRHLDRGECSAQLSTPLSDHIPSLDQLARNERSRSPALHSFLAGSNSGTAETSHTSIGRRYLLLGSKPPSISRCRMLSTLHSSASLIACYSAEPGDAEAFARAYIEPGLTGPRHGHSHVCWLSNKEGFAHLRTKLSMEWLAPIRRCRCRAREELFDLAALSGDRAALLDLIQQQVAAATVSFTNEDAQSGQHRRRTFASGRFACSSSSPRKTMVGTILR